MFPLKDTGCRHIFYYLQPLFPLLRDQNFLYSTRQAFSTHSTDTPVSANTAAHMDA